MKYWYWILVTAIMVSLPWWYALDRQKAIQAGMGRLEPQVIIEYVDRPVYRVIFEVDVLEEPIMQIRWVEVVKVEYRNTPDRSFTSRTVKVVNRD